MKNELRKTKNFNYTIPVFLEKTLDEYCKQKNISKSFLISYLLEEYLKKETNDVYKRFYEDSRKWKDI